MAFKMRGFNAGHGTGTSGSPNKLDMGSSKKVTRAGDTTKTKKVRPKFTADTDTDRAGVPPLKRLSIGGKEYSENGSPLNVRSFITKKVLGPVISKGKNLLTKKPKVTTKKTTPKTNTTKKNEVSTNVNKNTGPKNNKGPGVDNAKFQKEVVSKLPKNLPKSKLQKAFNYFMGGMLVVDIVSMFTGGGDDDKGGDDQAIQNEVDNQTSNAVDKGAEVANAGKTPPPPKKDPYAEAKKKDPNLDKHIAERNKHKKGTPEYDAAQNRINKAYGDKTRHGVTKSKGTKGRDTISRLNVPGIVDKAKLERKRKIGGTKIIQQNVNLQTGEHKERKTKGDKQKERFYDAEGNLTRKTKDKKNKQKDITKTEHTVTKVKTNKRTGKVKVKTRRRRGQKTGEFFKSLVGK